MAQPVVIKFLTPPTADTYPEVVAVHPDGIESITLLTPGITPTKSTGSGSLPYKTFKATRRVSVGQVLYALAISKSGVKGYAELRPIAWTTRYTAPAAGEQIAANTVFRNVTFANQLIGKQVFADTPYSVWCDNCRFVGSGPTTGPDGWFNQWTAHYVTNCFFDNCLQGPQGNTLKLARDVWCANVGADAFSDGECIYNCQSILQGASDTDLHPDFYQFRSIGPLEVTKLIMGCTLTHARRSQGIFSDASTSVRNVAIINNLVFGTSGSLHLAGPTTERVLFYGNQFAQEPQIDHEGDDVDGLTNPYVNPSPTNEVPNAL